MEYEVIGHVSPYKPISFARKPQRLITLADVLDGIKKEPDPALYDYDGYGMWTLKNTTIYI